MALRFVVLLLLFHTYFLLMITSYSTCLLGKCNTMKNILNTCGPSFANWQWQEGHFWISP